MKRIVKITKTMNDDINSSSLPEDPAKTTPTKETHNETNSKHSDSDGDVDKTKQSSFDSTLSVEQSNDIISIVEQCLTSGGSTSTVGLWKCSICGFVIPEINKELHELRCVRERRTTAIEHKTKAQKKKVDRSKERNNDKATAGISRHKKRVEPNVNNDDEDLDLLIAELKLSDSTCKYPGCKKSVSLLGIKCELCSNKYCPSHTIAEIHGCGLEAKRKAREKMMRQAQSKERGFGGGKTMDSTKRAQLQRRLDSKIEDMSSERCTKKKQSSKK